MPESKHVIIDAKVSLTSYERYCSIENEELGQAHLKAHALSIRNHVKALADKSYSDLPGLNSLEFVLMFMPIEAAFLTALRYDPSLFTDAFDKSVIIVSPTTLLITLRTISSIWKREHQNRNAKEIARRAGELYDKFVGFLRPCKMLETSLTRRKKSQKLAMDRLMFGQGNLVRRVESLKELGVRSKKSIETVSLRHPESNPNKKVKPTNSVSKNEPLRFLPGFNFALRFMFPKNSPKKMRGN